MNIKEYDVILIGGGIVGTATALALLEKKPCKLLLIEAETSLAKHQTGNNSGVIHSGLYYKPGSLKATNCVAGRELMYTFCEENNIQHDRCGKVVVATCKEEIPNLEELERRGTANGLKGLKRLSAEEIKEYEPHVAGVDGLFVPDTGIVDYTDVVEKYAEKIREKDGEVLTDCKFTALVESGSELVVKTTQGEFKTKYLVNCGGLQSDRIAKKCGVEPEVMIIPFRGEYYKIKPEKEHLVKNLIYPVPDPRFPFLGVHYTRMIKGGVEAGPNAVLAFKREGYGYTDISIGDLTAMFTYTGFWKMALKFYKMGFGEMYRSIVKSAFVKALQKLIPEISEADVIREGAGVRAQALSKTGKLLDDFSIQETKNMVHVLNAPSPAATASLSIGQKIADIIISKF